MVRDAQASLRMSSDLKREIKKIAQETKRSLSSAIELLLWRGVEEFKKDGILVDVGSAGKQRVRVPVLSGEDLETEQFAQQLGKEITGFILKKSQQRKDGSPHTSRDGPAKRRRRAA
jgi:hypothetical protein